MRTQCTVTLHTSMLLRFHSKSGMFGDKLDNYSFYAPGTFLLL